VSVLLRDKSPSVRLNAVYALGEVGGPHAVGPLLKVMKDSKAGVTAQAHAARCLAEIGDQQTLDELERGRRDVESLELKRVAVEAGRRLASQLKQLTPE
jgi:HEAT repeat protein